VADRCVAKHISLGEYLQNIAEKWEKANKAGFNNLKARRSPFQGDGAPNEHILTHIMM
jgi:hypothetical protein